MTRISVLGPLVVLDDAGTDITPVSIEQRRLLTMLAVKSGSRVSSDALGEHLELTSGALRTSISRLRKTIGSSAIVTSPPGYLLDVARLDSAEFEQLIRSARQAVPDEGASKRDQALALWSGRAFDEFEHEAWAISEARRLTELRCVATEELVEHHLVTSNFEKAILVLGPLIESEPLRDRLRGQLLRALAGSGRTAEAHRAFREYRKLLLEEVGTEPSAAVVAIERAIAVSTRVDNETQRTVTAGDSVNDPGGSEGVAPLVDELTFLLTEVETSTTAWSEHVTAMSRAIDRHDELLHDAVEGAGGSVFATRGGGGLAAVFTEPDAAVNAAASAQVALAAERWPDPIVIAVRMGIHTGAAVERHGDYLGPGLQAASSVLSRATSGQVLLSDDTRCLLESVSTTEDSVPAVALIPVGHIRLGPALVPVELFELRARGVGVAPLRSDHQVGRLPARRTRLIGRDDDLDRGAALLATHRLVTIIGPAGVGKSALGLHLAHRVASNYAGGCHLVDLSTADDPATVASSIAKALQVPVGLEDTQSAVLAGCADRAVLIVCDNAEHVSEAVQSFADELLQIGGPSMLVTSRQRLEVVGEAVLRLGPLDGDASADVSHAARLFIDRALEGGATVDDSSGGIVEIEQLVGRLDRLPLAIELAASSVVYSSPHQLLVDLRRGAVPRAAVASRRRWNTVDEMIDWSYRRLEPNAQSMLVSLGVTRGWTPVAAVASIWSPEADRSDIDDVLRELVRVNLVKVDHRRHDTYYALLETVRDFALRRSGDLVDLARRRHRDWFLAWAETATTAERMASMKFAQQQQAQLGNVRAALGYSAEVGELEKLARHCCAVASLWWMTFHADEGLEWLARATDGVVTRDDRIRHRFTVMVAAMSKRDWDQMFSVGSELFTAIGEARNDIEALALGLIGASMIETPDTGLALIDRSIDTGPTSSSLRQQILHNFAGELLTLSNRFDAALERYRAIFDQPVDTTDPWWTAVGMVNRSILELCHADVPTGLQLAHRAHRIVVDHDLVGVAGDSGPVVARAVGEALTGNDLGAAEILGEHYASLVSSTRNELRLSLPLVGVALLAVSSGDDDVARRLMAHLDHTGTSIAWEHVLRCHVQARLDGTRVPQSVPSPSLDDVVEVALGFLNSKRTGRLSDPPD